MAHSLQGAHQKTLGADKGYDTRDFVADLRISGITPHVAQNIHTRRRSAIDGRTVRHSGYGQSIKGRSGVPPACGGLQPDSPGQADPPQRRRLQSGCRCPVHGEAMTTTLEKPTALKCACPGCNCTVQPETPFRNGALLFCSDACAKGHPNGEPCHAGCGCECHG